MKNTAIKLMSMIILTVSFAVVAANAQSTNLYKGHIPFDFAVGKVAFEAGDYSIKLADTTSYGSPVIISSADGRKSKIFMSLSDGSEAKDGTSTLVFNRYEDRYFLSKLVTPSLSKRFGEPDVKKQLTMAHKSQPQTTSVLIHR